MAEFSLSIPDLFQRAFGLNRGKPFQTPSDPVAADAPAYDEVAAEDDNGTEFLTVRNTINARTPTGRLLFMPVQIGDLVLPNEPTVMLARAKHIVSTKMVGAKQPGTVKELITLGDWEITIRGIAINYESKQLYPEDLVRELNELAARTEALDILSGLTSLLGIYSVVIEKISFPEMVGVQHAQAYELKCVSDRDFTLEIE